MHGLKSKEMCDEIIAKKPKTFTEAYEIANTLEATHFTADAVKAALSSKEQEKIHKLSGKSSFKSKDNKKYQRARSASRGRNQQQVDRQTSHRNKPRSNVDQRPCNGCGGHHARAQCPFRDANCHNCKKKGHIAKVCRSKQETEATGQVTTSEQPAEHVDNLLRINTMCESKAFRSACSVFKLTVAILTWNSTRTCSIISKEVKAVYQTTRCVAEHR